MGDIADEEKLAHALTRTAAVIHFAAHAYVGESVENPRKYFRNNVEAALTLLNATIDAGVRILCFPRAALCMGSVEDAELKRTYPGNRSTHMGSPNSS